MSRLKSGSIMEDSDLSISPFHSVGIGGDSRAAAVDAAVDVVSP
eukprot:CAMPEP_0203680800 /NCGR_PEP_ID=MMETSP0090-20130426/40651_1 /ASSEMBLY_ACC=CAM_ASM_001088 /TAXON_ID=426623 /ORGANISM="Chaetoceros affinis, Strain CCMP159" /LENGTH=43 /DNA_ID= /DNA_START= /DNA_END= /DNA_ORIENTATION=